MVLRNVAIALSLAIAGCATTGSKQEIVGNRAAFDLQCDAGKLSVTDLGNESYGVVGCGKRASYVVTCKTFYAKDCTAIANSPQESSGK
jgi:hypothetical protein